MELIFSEFPEFKKAHETALKRKDGVLSIEHVYLTLNDNPRYKAIFKRMGYDRDKFEDMIEETLAYKRDKYQEFVKEPVIEDVVQSFFENLLRASPKPEGVNREERIFQILFHSNPPLALDLLGIEDTPENVDFLFPDGYNDPENFEDVISRAREIAEETDSSQISEAHIWMAMLENAALETLFVGAEIPREDTIERLKAYIDEQNAAPHDGQGQDVEPEFTQDMQDLIEHIASRYQDSGQLPTVYDLLAAIYRPEANPTGISRAFKDSGLVPELVSDFISSRRTNPITSQVGQWQSPSEKVQTTVRYLTDGSNRPLTREERYERIRKDSELASKEAIGQHGKNLSLEATLDDRLEIRGRDDEVEEAIRILSLSEKPNVLFHGMPGVGKSVMGKALAARIADGNVPPSMENRMVFYFESNDFNAGTRYRGDLEERVKDIVAAAKDSRAILFLDEIQTFVGGQWDIAEMLKPALADGSISVVGTTLTKDKQRMKAKNPAFLRRFTEIELQPASPEVAVDILNQSYVSRFAKHHGVNIAEGAVEEAVRLGHLYIRDRKLPESAIDILDRACSDVECSFSLSKGRKTVTAEHMKPALQAVAPGLAPVLGDEFKKVALALPDELPKHVFAQPKAVEAVSNAVATAAAGLSDPGKPFGNFLFAGPSGVGKTELTKALAKQLNRPLVRFDMSEYKERHSVARLIGAPPGYVGYDQGGLLTDAIDKAPYSVLLLDEIEKAHPELFTILLQVMDRGGLTSSEGLDVDFTNVIMVMTTNSGNDVVESTPIGFGAKSQEPAAEYIGAAKKMFSPEFIGRLGEGNIIPFSHLGKDAMPLVVNKVLKQMQDRVVQGERSIEFSQACRDALQERGFSRQYGARNLEALVKSNITDPLARRLLSGELGDKILVDFKDSAFVFERAASLPVLYKDVAIHGDRTFH